MAEIRRAGKDGGQADVNPAALPEQAVGSQVAQQLAIKGFCVVGPGLFDADTLTKARSESEDLDFYQVNAAVADGLLGPEGSARVADLDSHLDREARSEGDALRAVDDALGQLWLSFAPYAGYIGVEMGRRGNAVVHKAGEAEDETQPLTEKEVTKWQSQFLRHTLMAVAFLGPKTGILELQPFDAEDTEPVQVRAVPGSVVILRADTMAHRHTAPAETLAMSIFLLSEADRKGVPHPGTPMTPAAKSLEEWTVRRLQELKGQTEEDVDLPRNWQAAMNHSFHKGQMTGIGGNACHLPTTRDPDAFFRGSTVAPDYPQEVPLTRWQHSEFYDPAPDSYLQNKTFCQHGVFAEGIELFDNRFFNLSPHESKQLDPHSRVLMEIGYTALHHMGYNKKSLMNAAGGIYVGCQSIEWAYMGGYMPTGGGSGMLCFHSGRLSFCLGMKGPSISLSSEAASGLTALFLATESVQQKGTAVGNDFAVGIGVHLLLSPVHWSNECMQGWLSPEGRCLTFNASASGYIRGDGCCALAVKNTSALVDGEWVKRNSEEWLGTIAGGTMSHSGQSASMSSPHAAAEQQVIADAIRNACVSVSDVDGVEAHGTGGFLSDAVEVNAIYRAHRSETVRERLGLYATKSSISNQVEAASLTSLLRVLQAGLNGWMTPNLHLRQVNPHIDPFEQPLDILGEALDFPFRSTFNGVKARGLGGFNVYVLCWGLVASEREPVEPPALQRRPVPTFWPGGGGELADEMRPRKRDGYYISGTWSRWQDPEKMQADGEGVYACIVTLGENRWEKFQIWLDGEEARALHPGGPKMPSGSPVYGPDGPDVVEPAASSVGAPTWAIDGRPWDDSEEAAQSPDVGRPGDRYRVKLEVAGKWRMVSWEKVGASITSNGPGQLLPASTSTSYYLAAQWNDWEFQELEKDQSTPGLFHLEIRLPRWGGGDFQIVRDADWDQALYPAQPLAGGDGSVEVLGPDDQGGEFGWHLDGVAGQQFRIEFQRRVDAEGKDTKSLSWQKLVK